MASELNITVMINFFESVTVFCRPCMVSWRKRNTLEPYGFTQLAAKMSSKETCNTNKAKENSLERKVSSPTNRQFTVHLNKNCRDSSKARET